MIFFLRPYRAGAEALVHERQVRSQLDTALTLVSVDVAAGYDFVSRETMFRGLQVVPGANAPLVRCAFLACLAAKICLPH